MFRALLIGGFGFIGTLSRYYLQGFTQRLTHGTFPYGTLAVNVLGSLVVGFVAALTLVADGLVTLERVQVITYRPGKETPKT